MPLGKIPDHGRKRRDVESLGANAEQEAPTGHAAKAGA
jgi:hypothetical protein